MRVVAGIFRKHRLKTLRGHALRPTSDQLRETLFNVLGPGVSGSTFLDAYAGTGAVGIEALSRGAREVVFIESHRAAVELIRKNLERLHIREGYDLLRCQVRRGLARLAEQGLRFDFIFLDPPYAGQPEYHRTLRTLSRLELLAPAGLVIAEHSRHFRLESSYGRLEQTRLLRHGDAQLAFYRMKQG